MRAGDFSSIPTPLIDPATGAAFLNNQIPLARMNAGAVGLLRFISTPNLDGTSRNFHHVTTNEAASDSVNLRVTHNFTPNAGGRGGRGRGGGARAWPSRRARGRGGRRAPAST